MKKVILLAMSALLITGVSFAQDGGKKKCCKKTSKTCCQKDGKKCCKKGE